MVGTTPVGDDVKAVAASATGELFIVRTNIAAGLYYSKPDPVTSLAIPMTQLISENWNYGLRTQMKPGRGGTAGAIKVTPNATPLSFTLDATGSTGFDHLAWSTGGVGTVTTTTATKAKFDAPAAGTIPISVRAVDASGCSSDLFYTGQLIVCPGNANAIKTVNYDTPPWVTSLSVSPKTVKSKSKIKFKLTEKASVSFYVQKPVKGRTVGALCKKQTAKNKKARSARSGSAPPRPSARTAGPARPTRSSSPAKSVRQSSRRAATASTRWQPTRPRARARPRRRASRSRSS